MKRLRFLAWHRGTREADLVLGRFIDRCGEGLSADEVAFLEALLNEADQDILAWVTGAAPVPERFDTPLMAKLKTLAHMSE